MNNNNGYHGYVTDRIPYKLYLVKGFIPSGAEDSVDQEKLPPDFLKLEKALSGANHGSSFFSEVLHYTIGGMPKTAALVYLNVNQTQDETPEDGLAQIINVLSENNIGYLSVRSIPL